MTITFDFKKILIIAAALLAVILGVFLVYNFFFKPVAPPEAAPPVTEEKIPPKEEEAPFVTPAKKLNAISEVPVISPTISSDGQKVKYYSKENGNVFESRFNGAGLTRISSTILPDLIKVLWSPDKNKVISLFKDARLGARKYYYNYETGASKPLDLSIKFLNWSPDGTKIVYQYYNESTGANDITTSNPDGSGWRSLLPTRLRDLIVEWPSKDFVSFRTKPSGLAQSVFYRVDVATGDLTNILSGLYGFSSVWSPNGEKIIYSRTDENGHNLKLELTDKNGAATKDLAVSTFAEKCVWSQDNRTIFCAAPSLLPPSAVLPDDYYKNMFNIIDDFWQINTETGEQSKIDLGEERAIDAIELLLNSQEDYLLFVNQKDGLLYSLRL